METETLERRISEVIERCVVYWVLADVPRPEIEEMKLELQQHLRDAIQYSKPPEVVVGEDVESFAEAWADENRTPKSPFAILFDFAAASAICATALLATRHILDWTPVFSLDLWTVVMVLILAAASQVLLSRPLARRNLFFGPWWRKLLVGFGVGALVVGLGLVWSLTESTTLNPKLTTWSWPATLILAAATLVIFWFWQDPTAPARRSRMRR